MTVNGLRYERLIIMSTVVMGVGIEMLIPGTKYRVAEDLEGNKYLRLDSVFNEQIYPLRPLPEKHGRLIDGDAYVEMMEKECDETKLLDKTILKVCRGGIKTMPIIVEAE